MKKIYFLALVILCLILFSVSQVRAQGAAIDLTPYLTPNTSYQAHISSGEVFSTHYIEGSNPKEYLICTNVNCSNFQKIFVREDGSFSVQGENYWGKTQASDPYLDNNGNIINIPEGHGITFQYLDANGQLAQWIPPTMTVGQSSTPVNVNVVGFEVDNTTRQIVRRIDNVQHSGPATLSMELVSAGPYTFPSGVTLDVVAIRVASGPGTGETFYYAKGVGWVGWRDHLIDQPIAGYTGTPFPTISLTPTPTGIRECYQCKCFYKGEECSIIAVRSAADCSKESACRNARNPGVGWCENWNDWGNVTTSSIIYEGCKDQCTNACVNDGSNQAQCEESANALDGDIVSSSLNKDSKVADNSMVNLPDQYKASIEQKTGQLAQLGNTTGVHKVFFDINLISLVLNPANTFRNFFCRFWDGAYCGRNLTVGNKGTDTLVVQSNALRNTYFPQNVAFKPQKRDCRVKQNSLGDQKLNVMSRSLSPFYIEDVPILSDYAGKVGENTSSNNINIGGKPLNEDNRTPGLKIDRIMNCQKNQPASTCGDI